MRKKIVLAKKKKIDSFLFSIFFSKNFCKTVNRYIFAKRKSNFVRTEESLKNTVSLCGGKVGVRKKESRIFSKIPKEYNVSNGYISLDFDTREAKQRQHTIR